MPNNLGYSGELSNVAADDKCVIVHDEEETENFAHSNTKTVEMKIAQTSLLLFRSLIS